MSAWSPFRYRVYRYLWIALLASNIGTWMQAVGAAWLMVQLHASPAVVALVQTASYLPVVLVGVAAGAIADMVERRLLLLVTQVFMFVAAAGLAVVTAAGAVTPLSLLGFTFALGLGMAFNYPAWQAIQPELVPKEEFKQAVTLGGANINLGRAIGPAVGGLLIAAAGPWLVFALNAASFAFVLVVLWRWQRPVEEDPGPPERFAGAVRAGVRYAMFSHVLHGVVLRSFVFGAASAGLLALLPVYAKDVLGTGSGGLGLLYAGIGGGAVVTAAVIPRVRERLSADWVFAVGSVVVAAALLALALVDSLLPGVLVTLVAGVGWLFCLSTLNVASQEALPGWVRARGLAFYLTAISAGIALGAFLWGRLANVTGAQVDLRLERARGRRHRGAGAALALRPHRRGGPAAGPDGGAGGRPRGRRRGCEQPGARRRGLRRSARVRGRLPARAAHGGPRAAADRRDELERVPRRRPRAPLHRDLRAGELGGAHAPAPAPHGHRPRAAGGRVAVPAPGQRADGQALRGAAGAVDAVVVLVGRAGP